MHLEYTGLLGINFSRKVIRYKLYQKTHAYQVGNEATEYTF